MFYWIYDISTASLVALLSGAFVGFSMLGCVLARPFARRLLRDQPGTNELVGYFVSCHGVYYGILLGLLAVAAYQNFADVSQAVSEEAATLGAVCRDASAYPEPYRTELIGLFRDYTRFVIDVAWPEQRQGRVAPGNDVTIGAIHAKLASFEPTTVGQEILHAEAFARFNDLIRFRRLRMFRVTSGIPAVLWYVVVVGAVFNMMLVWAFDMKLSAQLILGAALAFFLGTVISLVAAMDHPFRGEVSVSPEPFEQVYRSLMSQGPIATSDDGSP
jgi:hypothetical protein